MFGMITSTMRVLAALLVLSLALSAAVARQPRPVARPYTSYAEDFSRFVDETATMEEAPRVALFRERFGAKLPGFYAPRYRTPAEYDADIADALHKFPAVRAKYEAATTDFARAFASGQARFRRTFADYRLTMPVYLIHSLGEMDGGTRDLGGSVAMVFGVDVIAKIHDSTTVGPFLDHELFHLYHDKYFPDCEQLWCSLWQEGLAVYVASKMNPGANDRQLVLTVPRPIRPEVEPRLAEAMCGLRTKLDSTDQAVFAPLFYGKRNPGPFPPRYGYFLGYTLARKIGETMPLAQMAKLPPAKVRPLLDKALASYGPCPTP